MASLSGCTLMSTEIQGKDLFTSSLFHTETQDFEIVPRVFHSQYLL